MGNTINSSLAVPDSVVSGQNQTPAQLVEDTYRYLSASPDDQSFISLVEHRYPDTFFIFGPRKKGRIVLLMPNVLEGSGDEDRARRAYERYIHRVGGVEAAQEAVERATAEKAEPITSIGAQLRYMVSESLSLTDVQLDNLEDLPKREIRRIDPERVFAYREPLDEEEIRVTDIYLDLVKLHRFIGDEGSKPSGANLLLSLSILFFGGGALLGLFAPWVSLLGALFSLWFLWVVTADLAPRNVERKRVEIEYFARLRRKAERLARGEQITRVLSYRELLVERQMQVLREHLR